MVKAGYKQTELGLIPEDWDYLPLGDVIFDLRGGAPFRPSDFTKDGVKVLPKGGVVRGGFLSIKDKDQQFCSEEYAAQYYRNQVDNSYTIVVLRDLVPSGPSIGLIVKIGNENRYVLAQGVYGFKTDSRVLPDYLIQYSNSFPYRRLMNEIMVGSTQVHVTNTAFKKARLPFPPIEEQQAIAEALSDVDGLIAGLDKLIAKKRAVKTAVMQQLLTGKKRLPGFGNGRWEDTPLPSVCWFQEGPGVRNTQFTKTGVKLLNGTNIFRGHIDLDKTDRHVSIDEAYGPYSHFLAEAGDIVIACSGITVERFDEKVAFVKNEHLPLCMNTSTMRFQAVAGKLDQNFLYQYLMSADFKNQIGGKATGSAQLNFGPSHVSKVVISLPEIKEQKAISTVLFDMDTEIAALETRRAKTQAIKQGMMQQLLTGRTRLL